MLRQKDDTAKYVHKHQYSPCLYLTVPATMITLIRKKVLWLSKKPELFRRQNVVKQSVFIAEQFNAATANTIMGEFAVVKTKLSQCA